MSRYGTFCCIALAALSCLPFDIANAQARDTSRARTPNQAIYLEAGGSAGILSLNFDRKFNDWLTMRIGSGWWALIRSVPMGDQDSDYARLVPVTINFVPRIRQGSAHRIELSSGIVYGKRWTGPGPRRSIRATTAMLGYRWTYRPFVLRLGTYYTVGQGADFPRSGFRRAGSFGVQF